MHASSDPEKKTKTQHDNDLHKSENGTFWTVCPYCYYMFEYDGVYKECCLRCQNCKRPFHGELVAAPSVSMVVEGKEQYYCGIGRFPLKYDLGVTLGDKKGESSGGDSFLGDKKGESRGAGGGESFLGGKNSKNENFVVISDDDCGSEEKEENRNGKDCGLGLEGEMVKNMSVGQEESLVQASVTTELKVEKRSVRTKVEIDGMMVNRRVKYVARGTKKVMGRGKRVKMVESSGNQGIEVEEMADINGEFGEEDGDAQLKTAGRNGTKEGSFVDDLKFFAEDDVVYAGFKSDA